jgi:rhodanese-related sulfurtransferase
LLAMVFVVLVVALVGNEISRLFRGYKELCPHGLTLLINRESPLVVDLSSSQDYERGHIAGARHVPLSQFDPENKDLAKVKELPVAVYCKDGNTSASAAARLVKAGFTHVYWLGGGIAAWRGADLPTVTGRA